MNIKPKLRVPESGPGWREGRDARRDRREAALRALGDLEERAWNDRAWREFVQLESFYKDAS